MALTDNLVSYWKLDEASGTREDIHGANDLTDNSAVGAAAGKINDGASFDGTSWLSHTSNSDLQIGDVSFAFSCWVKMADKSATRAVLGKSGSPEEYLIEYTAGGGDRFQGWVYNGDYRTVVGNNLGSPSTGVWYHIVMMYDASTDVLSLIINDGTADTRAATTPGPTSDTATFHIGSYDDVPSNPMNGIIDEVGFWKGRVLTSGEITQLYNGGAGLSYNDFNPVVDPPNASYAADSQPCEGSNGTITPTNTGGAITSSAVASGTLPTGYTLNADGTISKVGASMVASDVGSRTVYVNLTNAAGTQSNVPVPITITANPPVISYAGSPFTKYAAFVSSTANVSASGPAVVAAGYALSASLGGLALNTTSGQLTFDPDLTEAIPATQRTITGTSAGGQVGTAAISVRFDFRFVPQGTNAGGSDPATITLPIGGGDSGEGGSMRRSAFAASSFSRGSFRSSSFGRGNPFR